MKPSPQHSFPLGSRSPAEFLRGYWQKRPLLIRKAFSPFPRFLSPDELAGLACEKEMMSRLILEKGGKKPWEVRRGPFNGRTFRALPKSHWTLLVNGVDRRIPEIHALLDSFNFIPNWRIDDVMISYAVDKGNVGAHVDNFDVFLIQAEGRREWQIHTEPVVVDDFQPDLDVRLLRRFKPDKRWILEPGDMLYLPPCVPHHGIARGDGCMTYSIGFRAPSCGELVEGMTSHILTTVDEQLRYTDPELRPAHPGALQPAALRKLRAMIVDQIPRGDEFASWAGRYVTEPKDEPREIPLEPALTSRELRARLQSEPVLHRAEGSRIVYSRRADGAVSLFLNGNEELLAGELEPFAKLLTGSIAVPTRALTPLLSLRGAEPLLRSFINRGTFYFPSDPEDDGAQ